MFIIQWAEFYCRVAKNPYVWEATKKGSFTSGPTPKIFFSLKIAEMDLTIFFLPIIFFD